LFLTYLPRDFYYVFDSALGNLKKRNRRNILILIIFTLKWHFSHNELENFNYCVILVMMMSQKAAHYQYSQNSSLKLPKAILSSDLGDRRQATGDRRQATGDRRQATGDRRQATGIIHII